MGFLYESGQDRELRAILVALTEPLVADYLWRVLGYPYWCGVNLNFASMLDDKAQNQSCDGDADIVGIPTINSHPNFDAMFAIEVKTYKFSLNDELKGIGDKFDKAEAQADKLHCLGFTKTAILHVLTTENTLDRDRGDSSSWFGGPDSASARGLAAFDRFVPRLRDRPRRHHIFVWPWGSHPSKGEDRAGAGCPQFIGAPNLIPAPKPMSETTIVSNRVAVIKNLARMIQDLPRPPVWGQNLGPTVFGHCPTCQGIVQHFWDGRLCKTCSFIKNSDQ